MTVVLILLIGLAISLVWFGICLLYEERCQHPDQCFDCDRGKCGPCETLTVKLQEVSQNVKER
jgi:hypothetical protein